jgi:hypothetical protein
MAAAMAGLALVLVGTSGAWAQQPDAGAQAAPPGGDGESLPLSLRYRFSERYGVTEDPGHPETIVEYQVAALETIRVETEQAEGAPDKEEVTYRTVYTERPAKVGRLGEVIDAVRRYDRFQVISARTVDARMSGLFRDLKVWYHLGQTAKPEVICLTPDRPIREEEYNAIVNQIILPRLMEVLPPSARPVRKADTWPITRKAAGTLMDDLPDKGPFELEGTMVDVRKEGQGTALTAIIEISGKLGLEQGPGTVRARISFVFEPPGPAPAADPKAAAGRPAGARPARDPGILEAKGYIAKVQMVRRMMVPIDKAGRLQEITTRELVLGRRPSPTRGTPGAGETAALTGPPPTADENNSWLLYDDPQGRFHFRHPQELEIAENNPNALQLQYVRRDGKSDTLVIVTVPKEADPVADRHWSDPQAFVRDIRQNAARAKHPVVKDQSGWLPDQDWAPLKRKVYRYEAALEPKDAPRYYMDEYLVLFTRGNRFIVHAMSDLDDHGPFRAQVEKVIKSLDLGPSTPGMATAPAQTTAVPPAATRPSPSRPGPPPVPSSGRTRP